MRASDIRQNYTDYDFYVGSNTISNRQDEQSPRSILTQARLNLQCLLWVISGHSAAYHANGCFRVYSGRSTSPIRIAISECPLYSIAVIQLTKYCYFERQLSANSGRSP